MYPEMNIQDKQQSEEDDVSKTFTNTSQSLHCSKIQDIGLMVRGQNLPNSESGQLGLASPP